MSDARKRDPRLDAVQTASGAAPSANDESAAGPRVARKAIGILAALLIAYRLLLMGPCHLPAGRRPV